MRRITILGLGPGAYKHLTIEAAQVLSNISEIFVRTSQHPVISDLPEHITIRSFDQVYDQNLAYEQIYQKIAEELVEMCKDGKDIVYAVPGHPFVAEATTKRVLELARKESIELRIVNGLSFIEPITTAIKHDYFPNTITLDAYDFIDRYSPFIPPSVPIIIGQIHSQHIASEVKMTLSDYYPDDHRVTLIHDAGLRYQQVEEIQLYEIDRSIKIDKRTSLFLPPIENISVSEDLIETIAYLRSPDGCPWDREQDHQSLRPHLLEETYELLDAIDENNPLKIQEELGDLVLQIFLHSQIATEAGEFNYYDVITGINNKIIRRHPHVFESLELESSEEVIQNWERIKATENAAHNEKSLSNSIPSSMPALLQSQAYRKRLKKMGIKFSTEEELINNISLGKAAYPKSDDKAGMEKWIGEQLSLLVILADEAGIDAESALRTSTKNLKLKIKQMEKEINLKGKQIADCSLKEVDEYWNK